LTLNSTTECVESTFQMVMAGVVTVLIGGVSFQDGWVRTVLVI
jgi:hypothetical protein